MGKGERLYYLLNVSRRRIRGRGETAVRVEHGFNGGGGGGGDGGGVYSEISDGVL